MNDTMRLFVFAASPFVPFPVRILARTWPEAKEQFHVWKSAYDELTAGSVDLKRGRITSVAVLMHRKERP